MKNLLRTRKFYDLWTKNESHLFTNEISFFCAQRSGPFAATLCSAVARSDLRFLCSFSIDYSISASPREFAYARQCLAFYSKNADLSLCNRRAAMVESFNESEKQCKDTNKRLSAWYQSGDLFSRGDSIFLDVRRKITDIIADAPDVTELDIGFGPGTNVGIQHKNTNAVYKLDSVPSCTSSMFDLVKTRLLHDVHGWFKAHNFKLDIVRARLGGVPKNALTERSIIVEALLNGLYQKGIGTELRGRLKQYGLDLRSAWKRNKFLAKQGSLLNHVATLDVRNASNTQALLLIFHLIQDDWFDLMNSVRSHEVEYNTKANGRRSKTLEMFSSMGNGFTFELETLVFYALSLVVCGRCKADPSLVTVFGDDIVVPVECVPLMREYLTMFGFEINEAKSFVDGPFRESCGGDYYKGINIRPFYVKDRWTCARVTGLLNHDTSQLDLFAEIRNYIESFARKCEILNLGPPGQGDGHIHYNAYYHDIYDPTPYLFTKTRTEKQRYKHGDRHGIYFSTIVKVPEKGDPDQCEIGKDLVPFYEIYKKPRLKGITKPMKLVYEVYDVYGRCMSSVVKEDIYVQFVDIDKLQEIAFGDSFNLDFDPFIVSGGDRCRKIDVYNLPGTLCHT